MNILSIELSTSSAKCGLCGEVVSRPHKPGVCDIVTLDIEQAALDALALARELVLKQGVSVDVIALSSIWQSCVFLDEGFRPLFPMRTWADTAPQKTIQRALELVPKAYFYRRTGCPPHSMYGMWKALDLKRQGAQSAAYISSASDFFFHFLTGDFSISLPGASGSGFFSLPDGEWDDEILSFCQLSPGMLPVVRPLGYSAPLSKKAAQLLGLSEGTPVSLCWPDGALNQVAFGGLAGDVATMSLGTSGGYRVTADRPFLPEAGDVWSYRLSPGRYISGGSTNGAGNCLSWVLSLAGRTAEELEALPYDAFSMPVFLPFLYGERSPGFEDGRTGAFLSLKPKAGPSELYRAVIEGAAFNVYQCSVSISHAGAPCPPVFASGGMLSSPHCLNTVAALFGGVHLDQYPHASLFGAEMIARIAMGEEPQPLIGAQLFASNDAFSKEIKERYLLYKRYYRKLSGSGQG